MHYSMPPKLRKRGVIPLAATLVLAGAAFVSLPLGGYITVIPISTFLEIGPIDESGMPPLKSVSLPPEPPPKPKPLKAKDLEVRPPAVDLVFKPMNTPITGACDFAGWEVEYAVPTTTGTIVDFAQLDTPPRPSAREKPRVPLGYYGRVDVLVVVDETGRVISAKTRNRVSPLLSRPAEEAAMRWRFEPGYVNGKVTAFKVLIPFEIVR